MKILLKKLNIVKKLFISSLTYSKNKEHKKLFLKVTRSYFIECVLLGKDKFTLRFKGKHIHSFPRRLYNWINFIEDTIHRFVLLHLVPTKIRSYLTRSFHNYEIVNFKLNPPIHPMISNTPNETILEYFLEENGFKITDEFLYPVQTFYNIKRI